MNIPTNINAHATPQNSDTSNRISHLKRDSDNAPSPLSQKSTGSHTNSINLSAQAQQLNALAQIIAKLPIIDESKVRDLKTQIDNGSYIADYTHVAEKMIRTEQALS